MLQSAHTLWRLLSLSLVSILLFAYGTTSSPTNTCTLLGQDPYGAGTGEEVPCCQGLVSCLGPWEGTSRYFYLCSESRDACNLGFIVRPTKTEPNNNAAIAGSVFGVGLFLGLLGLVVADRKHCFDTPVTGVDTNQEHGISRMAST